MNNYTIIGIIQYQLNGEWREQTVVQRNIKAGTAGQAQANVLNAFITPLQQRDRFAQARWKTPDLVRTIKA
jgi:hypothetical protein